MSGPIRRADPRPSDRRHRRIRWARLLTLTGLALILAVVVFAGYLAVTHDDRLRAESNELARCTANATHSPRPARGALARQAPRCLRREGWPHRRRGELVAIITLTAGAGALITTAAVLRGRTDDDTAPRP